MSKRTPGLPQRERDEWTTPAIAAAPLLRILEPSTRFIQPCAGPGELIGHLEQAGHQCAGAFDLPTDARIARYPIGTDVVFIANPPWRRRFEPHKIIANLRDQAPLWALIYSDWLFNARSTPFLSRLRAIVSIGRVKWVEGSESGGFENACWCLFDRPQPDGFAVVRFVGQIAKGRGAAR